MSFAPVRLGNTVLEAETAAADRNSCRRFGPCGVGEKALYLNDLLIDRHFYVGFGSVRRVFKRVAMSQGGFSGKGAFGSIPYLVVQYDDGQEKQCTFKREEDVDELLAYLGQVHPEIPRLSVGGEQRLAKKAQQEASRYLKELTPQAQSAREELERAIVRTLADPRSGFSARLCASISRTLGAQLEEMARGAEMSICA